MTGAKTMARREGSGMMRGAGQAGAAGYKEARLGQMGVDGSCVAAHALQVAGPYGALRGRWGRLGGALGAIGRIFSKISGAAGFTNLRRG